MMEQLEQVGSLITLKQASKERGVKVNTLYKWLYRHEIPCVRLGGTVLVERRVLDGYVSRSNH